MSDLPMDYTDADLVALTNGIYGEAAASDSEVMTMVGSTVLNRIDANKPEEFGSSVPEVLQKGYYAVSNPNVPYQQAITQKFPDKLSENKYKQAMAIASGLIKGTIERQPGHFYFTKKEIRKLKKRKKGFNFKAVNEVGNVGDYSVYGY